MVSGVLGFDENWAVLLVARQLLRKAEMIEGDDPVPEYEAQQLILSDRHSHA